MAVTVPVDVLLRIEDAVRKAADTSDQISKQLSKIDKTASRTSKAINAISFIEVTRAAVDFGRVVTKVLGDAITEAIEADDAINGLASSLKAAGDFSSQNVQAFEDLANELASVSRFSDDLILDQVRIGKQFGLTNRETEKLIRASVEYASLTRQDLSTSVRQLGQTFDGTAGRIAENVPALKGLSAESLKAGKALDVILQQFGGSSQRDIQTFSGVLQQTQNQFGNIFEELGKGIVQNPAAIESLRAIGETFSIIADAISASDDSFRDLVTGTLQLALTAFGTLLQILASIDKFATSVSRFFSRSVKTAKELGANAEEIARIQEKINAQNERAKFFDRLVDAAAGAAGNLDRIAKRQQSVIKNNAAIVSGFDAQRTAVNRLAETEQERLKRLEEQAKLLKQQIEDQKKLNDARRSSLEAATRNPFGEISSAGGNIVDRIAESFADAGARLVGVLSAAGRGRAGATQLIGQGIEAATGIPGISQLVEVLAQGPDAVKLLVQEFADAIPDVILAIAESIPVIIETLAEKLPDIITKLVENAPRIIVALVRAIPAFAGAIFRVIGDAAIQFSREVLGGAFKFVGELLRGAGQFLQEIINGIGDAFNRLIDNINPLKGLGIGGGGDNPAGGAAVGAGIGFAVGGPVGALIGGIAGSLFGKQGAGSGFSNPGQSRAGVNQPVQINLRVGNRELAQVMTDIQRQGFAT